MTTFVRFVDFAWMCAGVYYEGMTKATGGFSRVGKLDMRRSGFQGGVYRRATGVGFDWVVAIAGTQPGEDWGADVVADVGFGGGKGTGILAASGLLGMTLSLAGRGLLSNQCKCAEGMIANVRYAMGRNDRVYLTGHSLGGGIAQIVSSRTGVKAVAISAPAVTAADGVATNKAAGSHIVCLKIKNDPINHSGLVGGWLGRVIELKSSRTGGDAHSIEKTAAELSPHGEFTNLGASNPF